MIDVNKAVAEIKREAIQDTKPPALFAVLNAASIKSKPTEWLCCLAVTLVSEARET